MTTAPVFTIVAFPDASVDPLDSATLHLAKRRGVDALVVPFRIDAIEMLAITHPQPSVIFSFNADDAARLMSDVHAAQTAASLFADVRYGRFARRSVVVILSPNAWNNAGEFVAEIRSLAKPELFVVGVADAIAPHDAAGDFGLDALVSADSLLQFEVTSEPAGLQAQTAQYMTSSTANVEAGCVLVHGWTPRSPEHLEAFLSGILAAAENLRPIEGDVFDEHLRRYAPYPGAT